MAESQPAPSMSLTMRTIRGVAWTLPASLGSRVIGLVGTLLLVRFLAPAEYGEAMVAMTVTVTAFGVTSLGVGIYLLSNRNLTRAEAFHATCWFLATGIAAQAIVWASTGVLASWFDAPSLARYMPLFVVSAVLDRISFIPERMLLRQLRFRWMSIAKATSDLVFTALSLLLAWQGRGAMSIAWAYLARAALRFVAVVPAVDSREWFEPHRLRAATLGTIIRSGVSVSLSQVATFLMRRWDNLLVSMLFGNATMGLYNYAYNLADTPAVAIGEQMSDVVAASFPHAEAAKRQVALVRACTMISLVMFPLAFGLGAVAETVEQAFFGQRWAGVGEMLLYLSILSAPRPMAMILQAYFFASQRRRVVAWVEWLSLGAVMAGIATIGRVGILWACSAVGCAFILRTLALLWAVRWLDGIPLRRFLAPLIRPLVACIAMVAAILLARPGLQGLSPVSRLVVEVVLGAAVYLAGARLIFRAAAAELVGLVRSGLSRR
jgi:PST family polysaccharide transporter